MMDASQKSLHLLRKAPAENTSSFTSVASLLVLANGRLIEALTQEERDKKGCVKLVAGFHPRSTVHRLLLL